MYREGREKRKKNSLVCLWFEVWPSGFPFFLVCYVEWMLSAFLCALFFLLLWKPVLGRIFFLLLQNLQLVFSLFWLLGNGIERASASHKEFLFISNPFSPLYICISLSLSVLFTLFTEKEYCSFNLMVNPPPPPPHLGVVMFPFSGSYRELYCSPRYLPTSIHAKSLFIQSANSEVSKYKIFIFLQRRGGILWSSSPVRHGWL